ncbi:hypothetical protein IFR05_013996, partial [Cadophora sp. M221]
MANRRIDPNPRSRIPGEPQPRHRDPDQPFDIQEFLDNLQEIDDIVRAAQLKPERRHLPKPPIRGDTPLLRAVISAEINLRSTTDCCLCTESIPGRSLSGGVLTELHAILDSDAFQSTIDTFHEMASSEVDMKFLGNFARNIQIDQPLLSQSLFQILGNITMFSEKVIRARKLRRLDTTRDTKSVDLYCRIIWYTRECLKILEEYVLPMVVKNVELKVLAHKLRASFFHLFVLFHNHPPITLKAAVHTPPGLKSPRVTKPDKGKGIDRGSPSDPF